MLIGVFLNVGRIRVLGVFDNIDFSDNRYMLIRKARTPARYN